MSQRRIGIILNYINIFLNLAIGLIYVPLILHFIGKQEYGLYQMLGSIIAYFNIMDFGLGAAVGRFYKQYLVKTDFKGCENILAIAVRAFICIDALLIVAGYIVYYNLDSILGSNVNVQEVILAKKLLLVLLANVLLSLMYIPFRTVINAHERFVFSKGLSSIQLLVQPVLIWFLLHKYPNALTIVMVHTFINLTAIILGLYYCFYRLKIRVKYYYIDNRLLMAFGKMSFNTFLVAIIDQIFLRTNQIVLGIISGLDAVAVYAVAAYIYMHYFTLSQAVVGVYFPYVNELIAKNVSNEILSNFFIKVGRIQFMILTLFGSGFVIFGQQFIQIWAGKGFEDSYYIAILVMLPFTIDLIQNVGILIMQAKNQYGFRAKLYLVTGVAHLIMSIFFGMLWGGIGCAFATCIVVFCSNGILMNWHYYKVHKLNILRFWKEIGYIAGGIIILAGPYYVLNYFTYNESKLLFLIKIFLYALFYCIFCYRYLMNNEEKEKVQRLRVFRKLLCPKPNLKKYARVYEILQLPKTRSNFALYVQQVLNLPTHYVWGGLGQYIDVLLVDQILKNFPNHYTNMEIDELKKFYGSKILAFDCSGLIKSYYFGGLAAPDYKLEKDLNSEGLLSLSKRKGSISNLPEEIGLCLYMPGHVGVYMGSGRVIECTSNAKFGNGVVETKLEDREWLFWFSCPFIEDNEV